MDRRWVHLNWLKNMLEKMGSASKTTHKAKSCGSQVCSNYVDRGLLEECGKANFGPGLQVNESQAQELRDNSGWEMLSLEEALTSLEERMPQPPSVETFTCILRKCKKEKNLGYARRLHAYMCKSRLEVHRSLGNYLVPMLVEVGNMSDAQQVFNRLVDRNEYAWTSLITGYIECGESQHALDLYQKMKEDCVHPREHTFVALLKACATLKDVKRGQEIHAVIASKDIEEQHFVGNTLVNMYAKCGLLEKAQEVFDKLQVRDVVSWTALMTGYAEHGLGKEALNCFKQMQLEGLTPNAVTFVCSLRACGSIGAIDKGQEIHNEIARKGLLERDPLVGSTLVNMYAKGGALGKAQVVFDKLLVRDAVLWNALIAGYVDNGFGEKALNYFEQMQLEGFSPDPSTFVCSLKACGTIGAIDNGQEIHAEMARNEILVRNPFVGNALVDMYAKCGSLANAREVFDMLPLRDVVSWTALIAAYADHGQGEEALNGLEQMQLEGFSPNAVTFVCGLKACAGMLAIDKGQKIHAEIARKGLENDPFITSILVDMYAKCGLLAKAQLVFDKLSVRDAVLWNSLIAGYAEHGLGEEVLSYFKQMLLEGISPDAVTFVCSLKACSSIGAIDKGQKLHTEIARKGFLERDPFIGSTLVDMYVKCASLAEAQEVFDKLPARDAVSWNALISGYAEHDLGEEALNCFKQMKLEGVPPDAVTFLCSLKACSSLGFVDIGGEIHAEIITKGLESDLVVVSALIDMYAKCGSLAMAWAVFDKLPARDVVLWNALIKGHAYLGESENVFQVLERMREEGIKPEGVTFVSVLTLCSHTGLVDKGQKYFECMSRDYGIIPTIEHHTCMVDLLGRAGQLDEAVTMMKKMPFHPTLVVWLTLLGACRKWGNVELGRQAFENAVQLNEKDAAAYILMSNIYADAHMQENEKMVQAMRLRTSMEGARSEVVY